MLANRDRSHVGACGPARLRRGDIFVCLFVCVCVCSFFGISIYDLSVYLAYAMVHHFIGLYIYIYYTTRPGPHWGTVRKKMAPDKVYLSLVYYRIF